MGSAAIQPSLVLGRLLRQKRREDNLSLSAVSDRLAERGHRIPASTLSRIEQGKLDPGVRRLHLLMDLYRIPPHLVSDLIELETLAGPPPSVLPTDDLQALHDQGVKHWKEGNVAEGLTYLLAVREYVPETDEAMVLRQQTSLAFATAVRNLGRYRLARQIVDDLLCEPPAVPVLVPALVLAASIWRGHGALDVALGMIRQAESRLPESPCKERAWVFHQKAKLLLESGKTLEAERALKRALGTYRALGDTYGEMRGLVMRVAIHEALGDDRRAQGTARNVIRLSQRNGHARGVVYGRLELGRLLVKAGQAKAGTDQLTQGLSEAVRAKDPNAEFVAHYQLWKAHLALQNHDRAALELGAACYFVRFVDEHAPEVDEIRQLQREEAKR
jgi:transcriptional regulator with XRE-family HTH domain